MSHAACGRVDRSSDRWRRLLGRSSNCRSRRPRPERRGIEGRLHRSAFQGERTDRFFPRGPSARPTIRVRRRQVRVQPLLLKRSMRGASGPWSTGADETVMLPFGTWRAAAARTRKRAQARRPRRRYRFDFGPPASRHQGHLAALARARRWPCSRTTARPTAPSGWSGRHEFGLLAPGLQAALAHHHVLMRQDAAGFARRPRRSRARPRWFSDWRARPKLPGVRQSVSPWLSVTVTLPAKRKWFRSVS